MASMWRVINIVLIGATAYGGFASMSAEDLQKANSDAVACVSVLLAAVIVTVGGTYYGVKRIGIRRLQLPSLNRSALGVWQDPLQYILVFRWMMLACLAGAVLRLLFSPSIAGGWMVGVYVSALLGVLVGEAFVYRRFRDIIGVESASGV